MSTPAPGFGPRLLRRTAAALAVVLAVLALAGYLFFRGGAGNREEIQSAVSLAVGRVSRLEMSGARMPLGAAVAIAEGVMLTPCRGIAPGNQLIVRIPPRDIPAQVTAADRASLLCKLAVSGGASWPLPITRTVPRMGERVYAVTLGPLGEAIASPAEVTGSAGEAIELANPGKPLDGSPLLDARGRVFAIAIEGRFLALPAM